DRIEHPLAARAPFLDAEFFAVDAVRRVLRLDQLAHRRLRLAVGNGDRRRVALALRRNQRAEMRPDGPARGVGEAVGKRDLGGEVHSGSATASRSGLPSTLTQFDTARTPSGPAPPQWTVPGAMRRPSPGRSVTSGRPGRETTAEPPMT